MVKLLCLKKESESPGKPVSYAKPHYEYKLGNVTTEHSLPRKTWEPAVSPCSPESQPYPRLHQQNCGQQGKGVYLKHLTFFLREKNIYIETKQNNKKK